MAQTHLEVEIKLEVAAAAELPTTWPADLTVLQRETHELRAQYFDTPERVLARHGVALRMRRGGHDAGWHLKRRVSDTAQQETTWELSDTLPQPVAALLQTEFAVAPQQLEVVAEINSARTTVVLGRGDKALYEIADDTVQTFCEVDPLTALPARRSWREWEIEALNENHRAELSQLTYALEQAGAYPSLSGSKIARAAGALVPGALAAAKPSRIIAALTTQDSADQLEARALQLRREGDSAAAVVALEQAAQLRHSARQLVAGGA